ncbi:MAG: glycosyltransferase family 4 protein [Acidobacteria bacterium]|nr:glycosyltransferase family 4 protein [Acidobacteriota bacterium]
MSDKPRVTFVVQRYGLDVSGGAEQHCRRVAERLCTYWDIEVATTCSADYMTWQNVFPPGKEEINEVSVLRFPVAEERDMESFVKVSQRIFSESDGAEQEKWMRSQGPYSPELFDYLKQVYTQRDLFVFFSYLYAHTYFGLRAVGPKAALVPMAHDEPPIRLGLYRNVFQNCRYVLYNSPEEKKIVELQFGKLPGEITGIGFDPPSRRQVRALPVPEPYAVYVGRIDHSKGLGDLFHYLSRSKTRLHLALAGENHMDLPQDPQVQYLGYISEEDKYSLLENACFLVQPSRYESLAISLLEAWSVATPVLVNGNSTLLRGQCVRSDGGVFYNSEVDFVEKLNYLLESKARRTRMGLLGQRYVRKTYTWQQVEKKYWKALELIRSANS